MWRAMATGDYADEQTVDASTEAARPSSLRPLTAAELAKITEDRIVLRLSIVVVLFLGFNIVFLAPGVAMAILLLCALVRVRLTFRRDANFREPCRPLPGEYAAWVLLLALALYAWYGATAHGLAQAAQHTPPACSAASKASCLAYRAGESLDWHDFTVENSPSWMLWPPEVRCPVCLLVVPFPPHGFLQQHAGCCWCTAESAEDAGGEPSASCAPQEIPATHWPWDSYRYVSALVRGACSAAPRARCSHCVCPAAPRLRAPLRVQRAAELLGAVVQQRAAGLLVPHRGADRGLAILCVGCAALLWPSRWRR